MGQDAVIYIKYTKEDPSCSWASREDSEYSRNWPADATHEVELCLGRYWSLDYPRGNWPYLAMTLLELMAQYGVTKVWYGHDCMSSKELRNLKPFTIKQLNRYNERYVQL